MVKALAFFLSPYKRKLVDPGGIRPAMIIYELRVLDRDLNLYRGQLKSSHDIYPLATLGIR